MFVLVSVFFFNEKFEIKKKKKQKLMLMVFTVLVGG